METLIDLFTKEMEERITLQLEEELQSVVETEIGCEVYGDFREIEYCVGEIFNNYSQIPVIEMEETIHQLYPFIKETGIGFNPWIEVDYSNSNGVARATVSEIELLYDKKELTEDQFEAIEELKEDLMRIYDQLGVRLGVEFEEIEVEEGSDNEEDTNEKSLRVIDIW